jgi:hypothetical protein
MRANPQQLKQFLQLLPVEVVQHAPFEDNLEHAVKARETAALAEGIANGSLSGAEFADYCLNAGYTNAEILALCPGACSSSTRACA